MDINISKKTFVTYRGLKLEAVTWGRDTGKAHRILALHGWLDNSATWTTFLTRVFGLRPDAFFVVALDFAGHGQSAHRHAQADYLLFRHVEDVCAVVDSLNWDSFSLIGHSMGGSVAFLASAVLKAKVNSLVIVDSVGPIVRKSSAFQDAKNAIEVKRNLAKKNHSLTKFKTFDDAVKMRMKTGMHYVSEYGTRLLCERGMRQTEDGDWIWSSDPATVKTTPYGYKEADVLSFLEHIECPILNIYGSPDRELCKFFNTKENHHRRKVAKNLKVAVLPGGHHLHLELDTVDTVVQSFLEFMDKDVLPKHSFASNKSKL